MRGNHEWIGSLTPEKPGLIPMSKMWVEKHRPKTVRDIRGQAATVERLAAYGETGSFPHLLFAGPPGTGKTTAALALCADVFGEKSKDNLLEMNASDERKLESIRTKVKQFARTSPSVLISKSFS